MSSMALTSRFVSVATLGLLCAFSAAASPIVVDNFSFEILPGGGLPFDSCGTGCFFSEGALPNWTGGSPTTSGEFQPGTQAGNTTYFSALSDGNTIAYLNSGILSQTVVPTVVPGTIYTLRVDLGRRNDLPFTGAADLLINGNHIAASAIAPTPGQWSTFTATYIGLSADSGRPITIELLSSGIQAEFDNVRLDAVAVVPEPAGVTLLGFGLAGLLVLARRKRP